MELHRTATGTQALEHLSSQVSMLEAITLRNENEDIRHLKFLFNDYEPEYYYMEVVELVRKFMLTCLMLFLGCGLHAVKHNVKLVREL